MYEKPDLEFKKYGKLSYIHHLDIIWGDDFWEYYDTDKDINGNVWSIITCNNNENFGYTDLKVN